jgi:hypothetical protein
LCNESSSHLAGPLLEASRSTTPMSERHWSDTVHNDHLRHHSNTNMNFIVAVSTPLWRDLLGGAANRASPQRSRSNYPSSYPPAIARLVSASAAWTPLAGFVRRQTFCPSVVYLEPRQIRPAQSSHSATFVWPSQSEYSIQDIGHGN